MWLRRCDKCQHIFLTRAYIPAIISFLLHCHEQHTQLYHELADLLELQSHRFLLALWEHTYASIDSVCSCERLLNKGKGHFYLKSVLPSVTRLLSMEADGAPSTPCLCQCSVLRVFKAVATRIRGKSKQTLKSLRIEQGTSRSESRAIANWATTAPKLISLVNYVGFSSAMGFHNSRTFVMLDFSSSLANGRPLWTSSASFPKQVINVATRGRFVLFRRSVTSSYASQTCCHCFHSLDKFPLWIFSFGRKDTFYIKVEVVADEGVGARTLHQIVKSHFRQSCSSTLVVRMDLLLTVNKHT